MKQNTKADAAPAQSGQHRTSSSAVEPAMNSKGNWTPGPWKVLEPDQVRGQYGEWICSCEGGHHRLAKDRANARIIAAAPELLGALEACADWAESRDGSPEADEEALHQIRKQILAAIAQATGGDQ